ncbi:uncharacterized protein DEA37_0013011 [Paragonimus westermani]|uniref:Uncharacterized protein n=1 Tax=Paragonimus westermani TaxID=34504 RepID=A0A5J4NIH5_9TREM|nr:uncharacterized protein DEA37_0013011 [Paragonimus westermani]
MARPVDRTARNPCTMASGHILRPRRGVPPNVKIIVPPIWVFIPFCFHVSSVGPIQLNDGSSGRPCYRRPAHSARCNFGDKLEEHLCDRLIAGVNDTDVQRRLLVRQDVTFQYAQDIRDQKDDVNPATADSSVTLFQKTKVHTATRSQPVNRPSHAPNINPGSKKFNKCFSCDESHLRSSSRFSNAICHLCGKSGHIKKGDRQQLHINYCGLFLDNYYALVMLDL